MKTSNTKSFLFIATAFVALFGWNQLQAAQGVDVKQAQVMVQQGALLLDVREQSEYDEVHAPNVMLIPLGQLPARMNELAAHKDQPIAVMCHSGRRSAKAVKLLEEAGYSKISNISGGIVAWENAGLPVVHKQ
jgi:rhodanese-related sulfurtransferase